MNQASANSSGARPQNGGRRPIEGVRVLDLSRVMSGPYCSSMLADLGADVVKVEMPGRGDEGRAFGPYRDGESTYFMMLNRDKKSVTIDMKTPEGLELVRRLAKTADVLLENFRPGVMDRLGLGYEAVCAINPSIVYASISGFGQEGPLRDLPAFDLVIQAMSGLMSLTGPRGGPATAVGESVADVATGMFAAFGIVAALFQRTQTGEGQHLDVSMLDSLMAMQLTGLSRQLHFGDTPKPVGNRHPVTYPVDSFPTATGDVVMVCFSDAAFRGLGKAMGRPGLADDPRFRTNADRNRHEGELRELISGWTGGLPAEEVLAALRDAGIPAAPVWDLATLAASEHVAARGLVAEGRHARFGAVPLVRQPVKFSAAPADAAPTTPLLGEHTEAVLAGELGLDAAEIAALRAKAVI
ncbi:CoA transferase [Arenibaculum sp.]|jgi:CoA:oxalate CoA-transferase|uniref:CaiB/BaiF CoA transferase family protein n=1 Tax=Arenibaculum sp. TaxID=2865862 RepID=UPI002E144689|nr:CoA transferase [Arenibaculum sp.]